MGYRIIGTDVRTYIRVVIVEVRASRIEKYPQRAVLYLMDDKVTIKGLAHHRNFVEIKTR